MKILDLPAHQMTWLLSQFNEIERKAFKKGYIATVYLLDEGKIIQTLLKE